MIDFVLTEEQSAMQALARDFVEKEVKPAAAECDRQANAIDCFRWDLVEKASKIGLRTLTLDKKYGGPGVDSLTTALVLEELAAGDLGFSVIIAQTVKIVQMVQWTATEEQCQRFLVPFRDDDRYLLANTSTEAELGSDLMMPYLDRRVATTVTVDGDELVINGTKQWSSGGPRARLLRVLVRCDQGEATVLVPRDTPGVSIGSVHDKLGERFAVNCEFIYDNVRVPRSNMIGSFKTKVEPLSKYMRASNAYNAACSLGVARAAFDAALEYARNRVQGGKRIIEHQVVGVALAQMYGEIEAARLLYWKAAWAADHAEHYDPKLHAMAKTICSETARKVAIQALELHGGYGSAREFPVEKYARDILAFLHSDGTNEVVKLKVGRCLAEGW